MEVPTIVHEIVDSPQLKATLRGHKEGVYNLAMAPDGRTLATACIQGGEIKLWDIAEQKERATWKCDPGNIYSMAFAPDGATLAVAYYSDNRQAVVAGVGLWDVASGRQGSVLRHTPARGFSRLAFAPDGKTIVALESRLEGKEHKIELTLWDLVSGKMRSTLPVQHCNALAVSADGTLCAAVFAIKENSLTGVEVKRWDVTTGKELPPLVNTVSQNRINYMAISPDGKTLAGADDMGTIVIWDMDTAKVRATMRPEEKRQTGSLAFAADNKTLAAALGDRIGHHNDPGLIALWDTTLGKQLLTLSGHKSAVLSVAFNRDGHTLVSGGADKTVRLWDVGGLMAKAAAGQR